MDPRRRHGDVDTRDSLNHVGKERREVTNDSHNGHNANDGQTERCAVTATMDALNNAAAVINATVAYLQSNAWPILFLIGVGFVMKTYGKQKDKWRNTLRYECFFIAHTSARSLGRVLFGRTDK